MITNIKGNNYKTHTLNWLQKKLLTRKNGVLVLQSDSFSFNNIQNFIKKNDHYLRTSVIYYQAFPEESAASFLDILGEELSSKLGMNTKKYDQSLVEIVKAAGLKMVIIDKGYLYSVATINNLLGFFSYCHIALILIGYHDKIRKSPIMDHPIVSEWEQYTVSTNLYN